MLKKKKDKPKGNKQKEINVEINKIENIIMKRLNKTKSYLILFFHDQISSGVTMYVLTIFSLPQPL